MSKKRDLHKSLKSEVINKIETSKLELALIRLAWSKDDVIFSLHVAPKTFSMAGVQITDLLNYIGFSRQSCLFLNRECYAKEVIEDIDLNYFSSTLNDSYNQFTQAQRYLEKCGFLFDQPEGWGFFFGKKSVSYSHDTYSGDGHTSAITPKIMKKTEDEIFIFISTWIKNSESDKGWTIHYRPKHPPLSIELRDIFHFLGIRDFHTCPQFDFESCGWRYFKHKELGNGFYPNNAHIVHNYFDNHQQNFSLGVKTLLTAQEIIEKVGMGFLPSFLKPAIRRAQEIKRRIIIEKNSETTNFNEIQNFDVAISFAATERRCAEDLAIQIRNVGFKVFYDAFFPEELWGKNLVDFFHEIYSIRSKYCVIFVSHEYLHSEWTIHERKSAQERMLKEKGNEYILPIKVDKVELPGLPATIGYLSITDGINKIAETLIKKLKKK